MGIKGYNKGKDCTGLFNTGNYNTGNENTGHYNTGNENTGSHLKTVDFKTACRMMWNKLSDEDKQSVKEIPNFNAEVFKEITGIEI